MLSRRTTLLLLVAATAISATHSLLNPLKLAVFSLVVGVEYKPYAALFSLLAKLLLLYGSARYIDRVSPLKLLRTSLGGYALVTTLCGTLFACPLTCSKPLALFFFFLVNIHTLCTTGLYFGFCHTFMTVTEAKPLYARVILYGQVGSVCASSLGGFFVSQHAQQLTAISYLIVLAGILSLGAFLCITFLEEPTTQKTTTQHSTTTSFLEGMQLLLTRPYVLGIFGLLFSYEVTASILSFQLMRGLVNGLGTLNCATAWYVFGIGTNALGLLIAFAATTAYAAQLSVMARLLILPGLTALLLPLIASHSATALLMAGLMLIKATYYGFSYASAELLYIPTTTSVKLKSKSWIDSFGKSISRGTGSTINALGGSADGLVLGVFALCSLLVGVWLILAGFMGRTCDKAARSELQA